MSRARLLVALAILTPLGFATHFYDGPGGHFVRAYLGGVLYVLFWIWVVLFLRPRWNPAAVALGVLLATSLLEVSQVWHPAFLEPVRRAFLGGVLIGTTFSWGDFPCYVAGALLGLGSIPWFRAAARPAHA